MTPTDIAKNVAGIKKALAEAGSDALLLAATKTRDAETVLSAVAAGVTAVGENRVQEFRDKYDAVSPFAKMHFIGTLQKNKVKYLVGRAELIHSVDSTDVASEISRVAVKRGVTQDVLIEINISREAQKGGVMEEALPALAADIAGMPGIRLRGVMTVGAVLPSPDDYFPLFRRTKQLADALRDRYPEADQISMGMSSNYLVAAACGATIVRVGSLIFGERDYTVGRRDAENGKKFI